MTNSPSRSAVLAIDQGTTNSKALLVTAGGTVLASGTAPVGVQSPHPAWVEQDATRLWSSVEQAVAACLASAEEVVVAGLALSTQRETVLGWRASTGEPVGPAIGWQDRRTADWCSTELDAEAQGLVQRRTGLRVDPMFSAPKLRWLLDHLPGGTPLADLRVGTVDSWLVWQLTGGQQHLCEAGNASRTLLYDVAALHWDADLLDIFDIPASVLPRVVASDGPFGVTTGAGAVPDGTPILAVLADSHAALFGHGCTAVGMAKATYGTGSSVMTPVDGPSRLDSSVPTTLAWVTGEVPTYALEGNILSSGATLAWAAGLFTAGRVGDLVALAETVADSGGVTLVPAFSGLGAPHWDREAQALITGMTVATSAAHIARAAVDAVAHQICDVVDVIEQTTGPLTVFRADGGATASSLVVSTQAGLLGREIEVADVPEVSALGAARLAWQTLGRHAEWPTRPRSRVVPATVEAGEREQRRRRWTREVSRARFIPSA